MKRIISILGVLVFTACTALGQFSNTAKSVMYDSKTFRFLEPNIIVSNQLVTLTNTNAFMGTQTFYAIKLGGIVLTNWPTSGTWGLIAGTITNQTDLWAQLTNRYTKAEINGFGYLTNETLWVAASNNVAYLSKTNNFTSTNSFLAITLGGVTKSAWPAGMTFSDGSYMTNVWTSSTNTLYIVDPTGAYTNKIGQFGP